ncbi:MULTISPECIES: ABC transporter substrate-binding protein [Brevibacillus]|jgi:ABC-type Fe3+-hydroxamate transport system, periplasmic component|uniref:ABC transporter substrate-binding protein n=1 Tax=Brevibacillus TaxID=55080 RepID=UPI00046A6DCC|nr:iron-siderophore ABC transporter substrate-binding protein [Brevibacillus borstelensis]KKX53336.1 iron siderophore-binding protein [Brevibacillus borstelensis cifa_chp40]MBE5394221.1 iron-siderophore ABC transporter substrate-binding protein [Brevibacillus borstelensis]MCC0566141.1 iron-siderophore ABC transporter substrate-binding protein [Brevibacillus borstelensis]MCM3560739.1 iron-siderophore ABC transporter substrate-binding protein [Brevibacillus borstelensis]MCM3592664.1 iron-siderop
MFQRTYKGTKGKMFFSVLMALLLIVTGCGGQQAEQKPADQTQPAGQTTGNASGGSDKEYVVKHAMGETPIKGTPQRVVVLTAQGVETLVKLGVKPVGAVGSFTDPTQFYEPVKPHLEGTKVVGSESQPNLEAIMALKPDLILGMKFRHEKIYEQLKAIAPTVFVEEPRGDWKENFMLYAEALNKKAEGEQVIADWNKRVEDFKVKAGDKLNTKVSIVRFMPGRVRIYYKDTFLGTILKDLGVARPASQDQDKFADEVTKERIPEMDGDIMFYFSYETGDGQASKLEQEWTNDSLWKNLNVVKNNKAFKVDDVVWNTSGGVICANMVLDELEKYIIGQ